MIELKSCPFCNGKAEYFDSNYNVLTNKYTKFTVECTNCKIRTPYVDTYNEAAELWNRRKNG